MTLPNGAAGCEGAHGSVGGGGLCKWRVIQILPRWNKNAAFLDAPAWARRENLESQSPPAWRGAPGCPLFSSWKIQELLPFWGKATGGWAAEGLGWARVPPTHSLERYLGEEERSVHFFLQVRKLRFRERKRLI